MAFCSQCGTKVDDGVRFCQNCGNSMSPEAGIPLYVPPAAPYRAENPLGIGSIIKKVFGVLGDKPLILWGLSLMATLLSALAALLGFIPIIVVPVTLVISAGMENVYLAGYRKEEVNSDSLFAGIKSFGRTAGGMGWRALWILIWGAIPIVGPIFALIKSYSYRFVPYIIMNDPEISATQALRLSMKKTEGFKGKMFVVDLVIGLIIGGAYLVLMLLCRVPYVQYLFMVVLVLAGILTLAVQPLFMGLVRAAFYVEIEGMNGENQQTAP